MLANELRAREANLRGEQTKRLERERQRLEKERILQERQRQREEEREQEKARKRLEQLEAERKAEEKREQLTEHNRGVYFSAMLHAVSSDEASVAQRGIKRASDKVSLPRSVGAMLMDQDAPRNGAMMFEITTPGGSTTHAGLLEFTAPEGVIALPRRVADCLWGRGGEVNGPVTVTYKRLEKGTFVRFQPLNRGFHEAVGDGMREVLERALMQCTTLTEGDIIRVDCSPDALASSGQDAIMADATETSGEGAPGTQTAFDLLVQELQPCSAVSLIDTDMEAQVVPSLETEQALQKLEEQAQRMEAERQERERLALEALRQVQEEEGRRRQAQEQQQQEEQQQRERQRAALEATLPPEPPLPEASASKAGAAEASTADPIMTGVFRMPDGSRVSRRFLLRDPVSLLFHFCDAKGAGGMPPGSYRLVMQYPRRVVEPGTAGVLADVGLTASQQEVLMLEPLSAGSSNESDLSLGQAGSMASRSAGVDLQG